MFNTILILVLAVMSLSLFVCFVRAVIGPSMPDRVVALDAFAINLIGFIGVLMIVQNTLAYAEVLLVISVLGFIGTIAFSKFIERGGVFERE